MMRETWDGHPTAWTEMVGQLIYWHLGTQSWLMPKTVDSQAPTLVDFANQVDGPVEKIVPAAIKKKKRERKRARDIILRDPATTTQAMKIRKATAFLGYDYKKPSMIEEVLERAIIGDNLARTAKGHGEQAHNEYSDQVVKSSTYHEPGGHLHPNMKRAQL